jgi:hypothetical protein
MRRSDITADWAYWASVIRNRFPGLSQREMEIALSDRDIFEANLARSHELSRNEVREELDDLIFVQMLAREVMASEYHSGVTDLRAGRQKLSAAT